MNLEKISKFIIERRKKAGLTQEALACSLHVTAKAVSKQKKGENYSIEMPPHSMALFIQK